MMGRVMWCAGLAIAASAAMLGAVLCVTGERGYGDGGTGACQA